MHQTASLRASFFRQRMEQKVSGVNIQLNQAQHALIAKNRAKLIPIVEAIMFLGRQNIPLRGHRDDSKFYDDDTNNPGNLQELLKLLVHCMGSSFLQQHIDSAPQNATYRSKTTQNEIIQICGEKILSRLCREIRDAKFFSILADEAADVSNTEQMPLVIRFVDSDSSIREEFLG